MFVTDKLDAMLPFSTEQIKEISEELDSGLRVFYHKQTGELIFVPNTDTYFDINETEWEEEFKKLEKTL